MRKNLAYRRHVLAMCLFVAVVVPSTALADWVAKCSSAKVTVVTTNGVWTADTDLGAQANRDKLRSHLLFSLPSDEFSRIEVEYLYNPTNGAKDVVDALVVALGSNTSQVLRWLAGLDTMSSAQEAVYLATAYTADFLVSTVEPSTLQKHITAYKSCLDAGGSVIAVPHSEGNFYVNRAYLDPRFSAANKEKFRIVAVGNPDNCVGDDCTQFGARRLQYTTSSTDLVINFAARYAGMFPLVANVTNAPTVKDASGHRFVSAYLRSGSPSADKIAKDIAAELQRLPTVKPPIIYEYVAEVSFVRDDASTLASFFPGGIKYGDTLYVTYELDAEAKDQYQLDPSWGFYERLVKSVTIEHAGHRQVLPLSGRSGYYSSASLRNNWATFDGGDIFAVEAGYDDFYTHGNSSGLGPYITCGLSDVRSKLLQSDKLTGPLFLFWGKDVPKPPYNNCMFVLSWRSPFAGLNATIRMFRRL